MLKEECIKLYQKEISACSKEEIYAALLQLTREMAAAKLQETEQNEAKTVNEKQKKKVYYISAEFLIGKLLSNNLINLGIYDEIKKEVEAAGKSLGEIEELETEPSLGNGGLGRLAACFLDSIATLGLNGAGIGLNYHLGLFHQIFKDHQQTENADPWINQNCCLIPTDTSYEVSFGGKTVKSKMYDIDIIGYHNRINKLHLFDLESVDDSIVPAGDIEFDKADIEKNLTLFLYPDDSDDAGRMLRIYQQYFMVSNGAQMILEECRKKCERDGVDFNHLPDYAAIQINDTHPTMVIPELIRLLMLEDNKKTNAKFTLQEAAQIVSKTCAYTNHTILAEALETWPVSYLEKVVPQLMPIIKELDRMIKEAYVDSRVWIIDDNQYVHMAHIDIHFGFSVNGVAQLHTDILVKEELNHFYKIYPEKFNNKTNGITFRRWLLACNHELADYIEELIGNDYKKDASKLSDLMKYVDYQDVISRILDIKQNNKVILKNYFKNQMGVEIDENSIFDVQVKRLHEYKRQQMNVLYIIYKYMQIKSGYRPKTPITVIFGAKAAKAYTIAKDIIHLILCLSDVISHDPEVSPYLKVVMIENYNVTWAEKVIPACDISEQISLASKEASGTSNMKFMLNGAVTLGTMDGANVEIANLVGKDNIYTFGASSQTVIDHYRNHDYCSKAFYDSDETISRCVDFILSHEMLKTGDKDCLFRFYKELLDKDWFMTLLDLKEYIRVRDQALEDYEDRKAWGRKMLINTAQAGFFSSDRTIEQYNNDIWKL